MLFDIKAIKNMHTNKIVLHIDFVLKTIFYLEMVMLTIDYYIKIYVASL